MFNLTGKIAIITGSSRGIGRAIAIRMAEAGARVVISSRKSEACQVVTAEIKDAGHEAVSIPCNISDKNELQSLVDETIRHFGTPTILVCNAATNPVYGPMKDVSDKAFDKIMGTNVRSNFWLANMVAPGMAEAGGGSIIIISSIAGLVGNRNVGIYGISKAADFQLVRNLALEWGKMAIRANCIAPGLIKTDFARALWEDDDKRKYVESRTPLRRIGDPDDIAGAALYLASDASAYMTGQSMVIDGGLIIADQL